MTASSASSASSAAPARSAGGCLVLRFAPDGRCASFHEYWQTAQEAACEPPAGWFGAA